MGATFACNWSDGEYAEVMYVGIIKKMSHSELLLFISKIIYMNNSKSTSWNEKKTSCHKLLCRSLVVWHLLVLVWP